MQKKKEEDEITKTISCSFPVFAHCFTVRQSLTAKGCWFFFLTIKLSSQLTAHSCRCFLFQTVSRFQQGCSSLMIVCSSVYGQNNLSPHWGHTTVKTRKNNTLPQSLSSADVTLLQLDRKQTASWSPIRRISRAADSEWSVSLCFCHRLDWDLRPNVFHVIYAYPQKIQNLKLSCSSLLIGRFKCASAISSVIRSMFVFHCHSSSNQDIMKGGTDSWWCYGFLIDIGEIHKHSTTHATNTSVAFEFTTHKFSFQFLMYLYHWY